MKVCDFIASIKKLGDCCDFGTLQNNLLRDRIVCAINNVEMQTRLLETPNLSLEETMKIVIAIEAAKKHASTLSSAITANAQTGSVTEGTAHFVATNVRPVACFRCGGGHYARECKHTKTKCNFCGKVGHLAKVSLAKKRSTDGRSGAEATPRTAQTTKKKQKEVIGMAENLCEQSEV